MKEKKNNRKHKEQSTDLIRIFTDGVGCFPDGKGSGYTWCRPDTGKKKIVRKDGLTNDQANYIAILAALNACPDNAFVEILTHAENTCCQIMGEWPVKNPKLFELRSQVFEVIEKKGLMLRFTWVPCRENLAGKLL